MTKKHILAAVVATVVVFVCEFIWHMALPFHTNTIGKLSNESDVAAAISTGAPGKGIYVLPNFHPDLEGKSAEEQEAMMQEGMEAWNAGPVAFIAWLPDGGTPMQQGLGIQFVCDLIGMLIIACLVSCCPCDKFSSKLIMVEMVAIFGAVGFAVPNWNWWGFSTDYTVVAILSCMINWGIGGAVIIKMLGNTKIECTDIDQ